MSTCKRLFYKWVNELMLYIPIPSALKALLFRYETKKTINVTDFCSAIFCKLFLCYSLPVIFFIVKISIKHSWKHSTLTPQTPKRFLTFELESSKVMIFSWRSIKLPREIECINLKVAQTNLFVTVKIVQFFMYFFTPLTKITNTVKMKCSALELKGERMDFCLEWGSF